MTNKYTTVRYDHLDEVVHKQVMDNGLEVFIIDKKGYNKKFATYTAKYGSVDNHFKAHGEVHNVPDGIAHFLEHKMFDKEAGDVFNKFSEMGASANAFTSIDRTSYLFSTTENFFENLQLLMDMVEIPYFTPEKVEKEIGIINEEIKMYQDNPGYRLYHETLNAMYENSPVAIDIAGTLESISEITAEHLYLCHKTFYAPDNMVMILAGDFNIEETFAYIEAHQNSRPDFEPSDIERFIPEEPYAVKTKEKVMELAVSTPKVMLGFKTLPDESDNAVRERRDAAMLFALDMVFGEQSPYYEDLLERGIVDDSFNFAYQEEEMVRHTLMAAETDDYETFTAEIVRIIDEVKTTDFFSEKRLQSQKRELMGDYLTSLNSPEYIANQFTKYYFDGYDLYNVPKVIDSITLEDIKNYFNSSIDTKNMVEVIVKAYE